MKIKLHFLYYKQELNSNAEDSDRPILKLSLLVLGKLSNILGCCHSTRFRKLCVFRFERRRDVLRDAIVWKS